MATTLTLKPPRDLSLPHAVCSYGYFVLAPNRYERRALHRPLHDADGAVVDARITQARIGGPIRVRCDRAVARRHHAIIRRQVGRMLRVDEDLRGWRRAHPTAARRRFGRLFRSPTLFEDIVKTMTGCNVTWSQTMAMNRRLVECVGRAGAFPTPAELAAVRPSVLKRRCKVGYRAQRIVRLAREVDRGRLDLDWFEQPGRETDELAEALGRIYGLGPYAVNNVLHLLGRYDRLAVDTETVRHFRECHGVDGDTRAIARAAAAHYERYAPYQFLAYWYELWCGYEAKAGPAHDWLSKRVISR